MDVLSRRLIIWGHFGTIVHQIVSGSKVFSGTYPPRCISLHHFSRRLQSASLYRICNVARHGGCKLIQMSSRNKLATPNPQEAWNFAQVCPVDQAWHHKSWPGILLQSALSIRCGAGSWKFPTHTFASLFDKPQIGQVQA